MRTFKELGRRRFLKQSIAGFFGMGMVPATQANFGQEQEKEKTLKVKRYRTLGRTGFEVSDIGGGFLNDAGLINAMLDSGVNYIDTAESYGTQRVIGSAIKGRDRKSIFITSKLEIKDDVSKEGFVKRAHKCLEELQTDYIDCMMMHMPEKREILKTEGFHQAMAQLKSEGRIRFVGISNHGSFWFKDPEETMDKVLGAAAEDGRFDVFLMAYNFLQMDMGNRILQLCKEKNIGTTLMKSTPIAKYYILKDRVDELEKQGKEVHPLYREGLVRFKDKLQRAEHFIKKYDLNNPEEIKEAAVRFVLDNPNVNTVCCSMKNYDDLERFVRLSGQGLSDWDREKLAAYKEGCGSLYCRHACGLCEPACPQGVPVNTIMRYFHYFVSQGREKYAMAKYTSIPGINANVCLDCEGYCEKACPYGVPIQAMLGLAHERLTMV
ncbi:MAG: aldo/keto reductase [Candidatus Aminicenantes bacterium]|nr:aldo/keto reductase [Candidatus Aminicenantes bacterium]